MDRERANEAFQQLMPHERVYISLATITAVFCLLTGLLVSVRPSSGEIGPPGETRLNKGKLSTDKE